MKKYHILPFAIFIIGLLFLNSCASVSGFHTGRTTEKRHGQISMGMNLSQSPNFFDDELEKLQLEEFNLPFLVLPIFEVGARYGITNRLDIGIKANSVLNFGIDSKFQVVGDQESPFAVAIGAGFGGFGLTTGNVALLNFQFPLYTSYHPKENVHIYFSPRYIGQFETGFTEFTGLINYTGFNTGVLLGNKTKFGFDFGFYDLRNESVKFDANVLNFGVGVIFEL